MVRGFISLSYFISHCIILIGPFSVCHYRSVNSFFSVIRSWIHHIYFSFFFLSLSFSGRPSFYYHPTPSHPFLL
ncbi:hypothetical protein F5X96DRAFT_598285 [Biscogniauxia mediterranea]|nr:hypothetical protein F5X96DRAFT_598285 [Biscogniauxia mediterranea]